jgi:hypothetical protein
VSRTFTVHKQNIAKTSAQREHLLGIYAQSHYSILFVTSMHVWSLKKWKQFTFSPFGILLFLPALDSQFFCVPAGLHCVFIQRWRLLAVNLLLSNENRTPMVGLPIYSDIEPEHAPTWKPRFAQKSSWKPFFRAKSSFIFPVNRLHSCRHRDL